MIPIITERLFLEEFSEKDLEDFVTQGNDRTIHEHSFYIPYPLDKDGAKRILDEAKPDLMNGRRIFLSIKLKENKEFVGIIELYGINNSSGKAKIGFWLGKNYRKKGYASEATKALLNYSFNSLKINKIIGKALINNESSKNLMKKLGFRNVGELHEDFILDGKKVDLSLWELLKKDFKQ